MQHLNLAPRHELDLFCFGFDPLPDSLPIPAECRGRDLGKMGKISKSNRAKYYIVGSEVSSQVRCGSALFGNAL